MVTDAAVMRTASYRPIRNTGLVFACVLVSAAMLPSVMTLPGIELTSASVRASSNLSQSADAVLIPSALLSLVNPDYYHAPEVSGYSGPQDITQFYFYQGLLLLPLALLGLAKSDARWYALALIIPAIWYAAGPSGGLYLLIAQLPGLRNVRSPVNDWFIVALGLALLAAAGVSAIRARFASLWIPIVVLVFTFGDLWYWNMGHNRLAYGRDSFETLYGDNEQRFATAASQAGGTNPLARIWAPSDSPAFGPLNGSLDTRLEVTYGYNPLQLSRYARYLQVAAANPRLLDSLSVTTKLDPRQGRLVPSRSALPRVSIPPTVLEAVDMKAAERQIATIDPSQTAIVEGMASLPRNGPAAIQLTNYDGESYRAHYNASQATFVRLAVPYFPGWRAEVDSRPLPVVAADVALIGAVVPAGSHELVFRYHSNWFMMGAIMSAVAWTLSIFLWIVYRRKS